uniref:Uncharacterized protein n=1 Tax=Anguilla anguilla TaxID=7936 RepID=A0A0E9X5G9_ANGAN
MQCYNFEVHTKAWDQPGKFTRKQLRLRLSVALFPIILHYAFILAAYSFSRLIRFQLSAV